jgi:hypothetical protein
MRITPALISSLLISAALASVASADVPAPAPAEPPAPPPTPEPEPAAQPVPAPEPVPAPTPSPLALPPPPFEDPPFQMIKDRQWFSGQVLLADSAVLGLSLILDAKLVLAFPFAAPIVHVANGDTSGAVGSFLLHAGAPITGLVIGVAASDGCEGSLCPLGYMYVGFALGTIAATVIDAAFLAYVERPLKIYPRRALAVPTVAIARGGGVVLGLAGPL